MIIEGDFEEAVRELRIALKGNRYLGVAWANLGAAYEGLGMREEGLAAIHRAIEIRPDWYRNYLYLGNFFKKFGEYEPAEKAYRKAIELKENSPMAWNNLGTVFLHTNRREEAIEYFRRSLGIADRAGARSNLGTTYFYLGKFREAEREYRLATELEPRDPIFWGNLGDALKVQEKWDEAAGVYLKAVKRAFEKALLIPLDPTARMDLALWCVHSGEKECAIEQGAMAVKRDPQNAEAYFTNAVIHCVLGNRDTALDWLEKAVKLGFPQAGIENDPDIIVLKNHPRYRRILEFAG